jgi:hypothetical protein
MAIRPAQPADGAVLHDLVQRAYGVYIDRFGRRPWPMDRDYAERVRAGRYSSPRRMEQWSG